MLTMVTDVKLYCQAADALKVDTLQTSREQTLDADLSVRSAPESTCRQGETAWGEPEELAQPPNPAGPAMLSSHARPAHKPRAEMTLGELLYDVLVGEGRLEDEPA